MLQAEDYKERIMKPREIERQHRKEQKLQNAIGPEFKGHGDALGGVSRVVYLPSWTILLLEISICFDK